VCRRIRRKENHAAAALGKLHLLRNKRERGEGGKSAVHRTVVKKPGLSERRRYLEKKKGHPGDPMPRKRKNGFMGLLIGKGSLALRREGAEIAKAKGRKM